MYCIYPTARNISRTVFLQKINYANFLRGFCIISIVIVLVLVIFLLTSNIVQCVIGRMTSRFMTIDVDRYRIVIITLVFCFVSFSIFINIKYIINDKMMSTTFFSSRFVLYMNNIKTVYLCIAYVKHVYSDWCVQSDLSNVFKANPTCLNIYTAL